MRIDPGFIAATANLDRAAGPAPAAPQGTPFAEKVEEFIADVNESQKVAEQAATSYANGTNGDLHGTMIALQQADITLRLAANVRNRVIEAYREVMRMGA